MTYLRMLTPGLMTEPEILHLCKSIWPEPYATPAAEATIIDGLQEPTGQVFLIFDRLEPIGLTGYFFDQGQCFLRWTGLVPHRRWRGHFRDAIVQLTRQLQGANPGVHTIIELVPDNEYGQSIVGAFVAQGFVPDHNVVVPPNEDDTWPVVPYSLLF